MHKVTIGSVEITALLDTGLLMNPRMFLPEHADAFIEEFGHLADERGLMPMAITCYLVRSAGKNILIEYRYPGQEPDLVPSMVAELVRLKVDVLVSSTSSTTIFHFPPSW